MTTKQTATQIDRYIAQIRRNASTRVHPSNYQALERLSHQAGVELRRIARKAAAARGW